jgi:hypothetical protein
MHCNAVLHSAPGAQPPIFRKLLFSLVFIGLCLEPGVAAAQRGASLEALNRALEALSAEHARSGPAAEVLGELLDVATQRQELLAALVEQDPGQVLALAIPADVRESLPAAVQAKLERHVELEGEVTALYEDYEEHAVLRHFLKANGERRSLHFAEEPPDLLTGDRVRVRGVEVPSEDATEPGAVVAYCCGGDGGLLALAGGNGNRRGGSDAGATVPESRTTGERRILTILVNFEDYPVESYTVADAQSFVFGTTNDFIVEASYQQTWLSGDVAGWYTIPHSIAVCDLWTIASQAKSAASAAGFDLGAYQHFVYAFPRGGACTGIALGTLGGGQVWLIIGLELQALSHELGHNFGLNHARSLDCGDSVLGTDCKVQAYGDWMDTMGNEMAGHYNAFHKDRLGWLDSGTAPSVTEVQANGVYTIKPLETAGSGPGALAILKSADPTTAEETWYYVEYRRALGFDGFLATNDNVLNGVIVHTGSPSNGSHLLDMTPGSGLQNWSDWSDPALEVGESFYDPDSGVTITPLSASSTAAEVSVTFEASACQHADPFVTVSPLQDPTVSAGSAVDYAVSVTNQDPSSCVASSFALQADLPSGWNGDFSASALTPGPGMTSSTTLTVSSPSAAGSGTYGIGVSASNSSAPTYAASTSASYVISDVTTSGLHVTAASDRAIYNWKERAEISAAVTADGAPVANASVSFLVTSPSGRTTVEKATTGGDGTAAVRLRFRRRDPPGQYHVRAEATASSSLRADAWTSFTLE